MVKRHSGCFCFQAEDGIRDSPVTGVQTCALPISTEAFFSENDQTRISYDKFREQFGRDEIVLALIQDRKSVV